jgi:hypothetical protein
VRRKVFFFYFGVCGMTSTRNLMKRDPFCAEHLDIIDSLLLYTCICTVVVVTFRVTPADVKNSPGGLLPQVPIHSTHVRLTIEEREREKKK